MIVLYHPWPGKAPLGLLLRKGLFNIKSKSRQVFRQIKVKFWTVHVEIGTVLDFDSKKLGEIVGQYMMIFSTKKVEFWVRTSQNWTVLDNFWT